MTIHSKYIDDLVDSWHTSSYAGPLWEFLGLTRDEYQLYVEKNKFPEELHLPKEAEKWVPYRLHPGFTHECGLC